MKTLSLANLVPGESGRITGITLPSDLRQRLLEMGLTKGVVCRLIRFAPLGDPLELEVRGYRLSLRKAEAEGVLIETT
jgi:Fe2+ transport system protein FeoA